MIRSFFTGILLFASGAVVAQSDALRISENHAFQVGEQLTFSIGWEFISAGTATLSVESIQTVRDRPCYAITAVTHSNAFFSKLYLVQDKLETFVDQTGLYPLRYVKNTSEGGYKRNFSADFFHEQQMIAITDADSGKKEIPAPIFIQDIISSFYFLRNQSMAIGHTFTVAAFDNGKIFYADVRILRKEKISVTAGDFDCVVVSTPIGPFNNKSDLNIWLTDDDRRIPVLMKSKIAIGSIRAELESMTGTK